MNISFFFRWLQLIASVENHINMVCTQYREQNVIGSWCQISKFFSSPNVNISANLLSVPAGYSHKFRIGVGREGS